MNLPIDIETNDVLYIADHPWTLTESEWSLKDKSRYDHTISDIFNRLQLTINDGYSKIWKTLKNEPIAILGCYRVDDKTFETFFIASHYMEAHALKLSFDMRTIIREKALGYHGCTCRLYSTSEHPSQITWFRFLGFKYIPERNLGMTRYFEYKSPK